MGDDDRPSEPSRGQTAFGLITNVKPGLYIVKFWQGIMDIVVHVAVAVLGLLCLIAGASFGGDVFAPSRAPAGSWLGFVGFVVMAIEITIIGLRFVNFQFVLEYSFLVMIANLVYCGVALAAVFCGFIPCAVYANELQAFALNTDTLGSQIQGSAIKAGFAAAFAFILMAGLVVELVLAILWYILKWYKPLAGSYDVSSGGDQE